MVHKTFILLSCWRVYDAVLSLTSLLLLKWNDQRRAVLRSFFHHWLRLGWQVFRDRKLRKDQESIGGSKVDTAHQHKWGTSWHHFLFQFLLFRVVDKDLWSPQDPRAVTEQCVGLLRSPQRQDGTMKGLDVLHDLCLRGWLEQNADGLWKQADEAQWGISRGRETSFRDPVLGWLRASGGAIWG